jgi:hypothetical protein
MKPMPNATLSFGVKGPNQDWTTSIAVSEANSQRILAYLMFGTDYGKITTEDGTETQATAEEAAQAFARGILQGLLDQTTRYERQEAAKAAAEAIEPIEIE